MFLGIFSLTVVAEKCPILVFADLKNTVSDNVLVQFGKLYALCLG